jgi:PAS domain S-box-containing protein
MSGDVVALLGATPGERLERLVSTLDAIEEGLQLISPDWRYLYVNEAVCRHGRKAREELLGRTMMEAYPGIEDTPMFATLREVMASRTPRTLRNEFTYPDGGVGWFELRVEAHPGGIVIFSRDITAQRRLELEAELAQRFDALGRLAGGVAHDFNNFLTVILTCTSLVLDELAPESPLREELHDAMAAAESAGALTRQLLGFSRSRHAALEPVRFDAVARETERLLGHLVGRDVDLRVAVPDEPLVVRANRTLLQQVLVNLVVNARDAVHGHGTVSVRLGRVGAPEHPRVELAVTDSGDGLDERTRARIFEPFFTTKAPGRGTGLGLSTVLAIVNRLGGELKVESSPGAGATFTVALPLVPELPAAA